MSGFRALYVPLIFILPWVGVPAGLYFGKIKKLNESWDQQLQARNTSRGVYNSGTTFERNWPVEGQDENPKFAEAVQDRQQDEDAFAQKKTDKQQELVDKTVERDAHKKLYDEILNRFMAGISRDKFDYEKPDEFLYELLKQQRDKVGPHLIQFLHKAYPDLYFIFATSVPAPPINLTGANLPQTGTQGRLVWPVGGGPVSMTVYGLYDDLLNFVETFPDRYDRITYLRDFSLQRVAFDYEGHVLMRLSITAEFFVWPENVAAAAPAQPAGGMGFGGDPMMGGMGPEGMSPEGMSPGGEAGPPPAESGAPPPPAEEE